MCAVFYNLSKNGDGMSKVKTCVGFLPIIGAALLARYVLTRRKNSYKAILKDAWGLDEAVVYDHQNNKLLTPYYRGNKVWWNVGGTSDTKKASEFKKLFDKMFEPEGLTLAYTVSVEGFTGNCGCGVMYPDLTAFNWDLLSNFIVKDAKTGLYKALMKRTWVYCGNHWHGGTDDLVVPKRIATEIFDRQPFDSIMKCKRVDSR